MIPLAFSIIVIVTWCIFNFGKITKDNILDDKLIKGYILFVLATISFNALLLILKFSLTSRIYIALFILLLIFVMINIFLSYYIYKSFKKEV